MCESRFGESRSPVYNSYSSGRVCSSESRTSSESHGISSSRGIIYSSSSESRVASESCTPVVRRASVSNLTPQGKAVKKAEDTDIPAKYNSFEDIDTLIEQLEQTLPLLEQLQSRGTKYSKSLKRRQEQIEKLRQIKEDRIISEIEKESDEFEEKINEVKKLTKTPARSHPSWGYDSSESRDGESRW